MNPKLWKIARYILSGGTATAANLVLLFIFVHFLGIHYLIASIIAILLATVVSFTLQKFWTFADRATEALPYQFVLYAGITLVNIAINTGLMYFFVSICGIWYLLAQVLSALLIALWSFFMYQKFIFGQPRTSSSQLAVESEIQEREQ